MSDRSGYPGGELELFACARRWKEYLAATIAPHLRGRVLEVGAGIAATTPYLFREPVTEWVCLEPDQEMAARIQDKIASRELPSRCRSLCGTLADLPAADRFQAILYIDVLEHIAADGEELALAAGHLAAGGKLIVLSPAHPWLMSEFDAAIGHHRRYTRRALLALAPRSLQPVQSGYLDSAGLLASAANRLLLRQGLPSASQIAFWDGVLVRLSRCLDGALGHRVGKSVWAVWIKRDSAAPR